VVRHALGRRKLFPVAVGREGTVRDAVQADPFPTAGEKSAVQAQARAAPGEGFLTGNPELRRASPAVHHGQVCIVHGAYPEVPAAWMEAAFPRSCSKINVDGLSVALIAQAAEYGQVDRVGDRAHRAVRENSIELS